MLEFILYAPIPWRKRIWMVLGLLFLKVRAVFAGAGRGEPSRIICLFFTRAGDLICATPFLAALKRRFPAAPITLIVYREVREVAEGIDEVDRVVALDRRSLLASARQLIAERGDRRTILVSHSINPLVALLFLVSPARIAAGYLWAWIFTRGVRGGLHLEKLSIPFDHLVRQHSVIAEALGIPLDPPPEIHWSIRAERVGSGISTLLGQIDEQGRAGIRTLLVVPGSRDANRAWPVEHFTKLIERLASRSDVRIVLGGSRAESETAESLVQISPERIVSVAGKSNFTEFAAIVSRVALVICNDSAASHLSAVFKTPCVAFFGPVAPELRDHRRVGHLFVAVTGTERCRCGYDFFREGSCPHGIPCIRSIDPDKVHEACAGILDGQATTT